VVSSGDPIRTENEEILALLASGGSQKAYERAIRNVDRAAAAGSAALEGNCAFTLGRAAHESGQVPVAIMAYARAAGIAKKLGNATVFGQVMINLATAYLEDLEQDRKGNLEKAIACQHMALETCTEVARPLDYAKLQYNMGFAYAELTTRFNQGFRAHAKQCFSNAGRVFRAIEMTSDANKAEEASRAIEV
jgi:tetratricopeptide (TPR) repeat protein